MKRMNKQKGFTIIELVVVILLLGILTATALPRFMDVTTQAHGAVANGVQSALQASTSMFYATWTAKGKQASATVIAPYSSQVNADGYPVTAAANADVLTAANCVAIYNDLMAAGGRPVVTANATPTVQPTALQINNANAASDFLAYVDSGTTTVCRYVYVNEAVVAGSLTTREISYNSDTGVVALGVTLTLLL
jgi:MSHA pilin protein MshB